MIRPNVLIKVAVVILAQLDIDYLLHVANRPLLSDDGLYMVSQSKSAW